MMYKPFVISLYDVQTYHHKSYDAKIASVKKCILQRSFLDAWILVNLAS
jgi:hypothetical protein